VLGSLGARYGDLVRASSGLTTPAPVELHAALADFRTAGATTVIIEVTSHALLLQRVAGLTFQGGLISAIKPGEHSDFHGAYDEYVAAKRRLLGYLDSEATLAFDADNRAARTLAQSAAVSIRSGFSLLGRPAACRLRNIALDYSGARFTLNGRRLHSSLLGRGNLENVALALAYALAAGATIEQVRPVLRRLEPLPRRMERSAIGGRLVLDDTAGHPDSLRATFEVVDMLRQSPLVSPAGRIVVVYAARGSRGEEINRRNALALADLVAEQGVERLLVTASHDVTGPHDRATPEEIDATRSALASRFQPFDWFDDLQSAARAALTLTAAGDLVVLAGAQGMNEGTRLLEGAL
jgi:UDP-N-acetylmuramoyl-L-alanyl-D-glutamate--2,6-diaminopimelate ligase